MRKLFFLLFANLSLFSGEGNLSLPYSQQPGPLISFGENIIDRNQAQLFLYGDLFKGENKSFTDLMPGILYGITDHFSAFFNTPLAVDYRQKGHHSSGMEDIFLQLEYAFYDRRETSSTDAATLVVAGYFPTGSSHKDPPTGFGSMSYFVGATYNHTEVEWLFFTSYGTLLTTTHRETKFGNQFLYQGGIGKNISASHGWIVTWMAEIDGYYETKNRIDGKRDPNSGGNVIYLTPSLWASSTRWILQLGLGIAVQQHLFGHQGRDSFLSAFNVGYTF